MKRCFFLLVMIMAFLCSSAQDTIRFRNGRVEAAKVAEVGLGKVKYKKFNNPDGPLFLLNEDEVESIKFQNGDMEVFDSIPQENLVLPQRKHVVVKAGPVYVERVKSVNTEEKTEKDVDTKVVVSRHMNSAKYPLAYRKNSPSLLAFNSEYISMQSAYEILGNDYDVFRENVRGYRTGRVMWVAGAALVFVSGPIAIGAAINDSHAARRVALTALCSGSVLFSVGMVKFVTGKRISKNVLREYNFEYNSKNQNVSELKFGLTGNGVGVNLTF